MNRVRPLILVVLLACLHAGCTSRDEAAGRALVRDSAGIAIVENAEAPGISGNGGAGLGEARAAELVIGGAAGAEEQELHRVVGAVRLSDGTIAVANAGSGEIRLYGSGGAFAGALGRSGDGPGEFRRLGWIGRADGDTLLAWDGALNRITLFTRETGRVRDYTVELPGNPTSVQVRGLLGGGRLVMSRGASFVPVADEAGVQRQPLSAFVVGPQGEVLHELGPFEGEAVELRPATGGGGIIRTPVPFGATTLLAARGDRIVVTGNTRYDLRVFQPDGTLERIIRRPHQPRRVEPSDVSAYVEQRMSELPPVDEIRAAIRASIEAVPVPEFMPAIGALRLDAGGRAWAKAATRAGDAVARWSVFAADGGWLRDVPLPADAELLEAGEDYLLVLARDEFGVESVRLIRFSD